MISTIRRLEGYAHCDDDIEGPRYEAHEALLVIQCDRLWQAQCAALNVFSFLRYLPDHAIHACIARREEVERSVRNILFWNDIGGKTVRLCPSIAGRLPWLALSVSCLRGFQIWVIGSHDFIHRGDRILDHPQVLIE